MRNLPHPITRRDPRTTEPKSQIKRTFTLLPLIFPRDS